MLGDKAAEDVPFAVKGYNAALILNQQPQTLGQVLDNHSSVRTSYGLGNAAEQFVIAASHSPETTSASMVFTGSRRDS